MQELVLARRETERSEARLEGLGKKVSIRRITSWPLPESTNESVLLEIKARGDTGR